MNKNELKKLFNQYFNKKIESIETSEKMDCYYVAGTDSRELLGAINFMWQYDFISDTENKKLREIAYEHLIKAERKIKHSL